MNFTPGLHKQVVSIVTLATGIGLNWAPGATIVPGATAGIVKPLPVPQDNIDELGSGWPGTQWQVLQQSISQLHFCSWQHLSLLQLSWHLKS